MHTTKTTPAPTEKCATRRPGQCALVNGKMIVSVGTILSFECPFESHPVRTPDEIIEYSPVSGEQYVVIEKYDEFFCLESTQYPEKVIAWVLIQRGDRFYYKKNMYNEELTELIANKSELIPMTDTQFEYIPYDEEEGEPEVNSWV